MQICTSLQTDNHADTPPLSFYRPGALLAAQPTASKHWRPMNWNYIKLKLDLFLFLNQILSVIFRHLSALCHGDASAELIKVSRTQYLTVKILSADFAAASKNSGKKSLLPSKNRHYVSDWCQRKWTYQQTIYGFVLFWWWNLWWYATVD